MSIAGSDSGGSAGLAADLHSFAEAGVHGVFALTVVTAQNTAEIRSAHQVPVDNIAEQIDALCDDFDVAAVKTGMLGRLAVSELVVDRVGAHPRLVVDPVLVNRRGEPMFGEPLVEHTRCELLARATLCTPNVGEARLLSGIDIVDRRSLMAACGAIAELGPGATVVTGWLDGDVVLDAWCVGRDEPQIIERRRVMTRNVHGSGCSFAATATARLARGQTVESAIHGAGEHVHAAIEAAASWRLGRGQGPIRHVRPSDDDGGTVPDES